MAKPKLSEEEKKQKELELVEQAKKEKENLCKAIKNLDDKVILGFIKKTKSYDVSSEELLDLTLKALNSNLIPFEVEVKKTLKLPTKKDTE